MTSSPATNGANLPMTTKARPSRRRPRFGLRTLLLLPVLVAAFHGGWASRRDEVEGEYQRQQATARERIAMMQAFVRKQYRSQLYEREAILQTIEKAEHNRRIESYRMRLRDPLNPAIFHRGKLP